MRAGQEAEAGSMRKTRGWKAGRGFAHRLALSCLLLLGCGGVLRGQQTTDEIDDPEELYTYAAGLVERKFYDLSLEQLNRFRARYPDHKYIGQVYQLLIFCNNATRRTEETERLMAEFRRRWPDSPMNEHFLRMCGARFFGEKDFAEAEKYYGRLRKSKDPVVAEEAAYYAAQCAESLGRKEQAAGLMKLLGDREFDAKFPYRPYGAYYVAMRLLEGKRYEESLKYLRRLAGAASVPEALLEESLERAGEVLYRLGRHGEALGFYGEYLVRFGDRPRAGIVRRQRILCCYQLGRYDKVREYYQDWRLSHLEENDFELDFVYAGSLSRQGAYEEACKVFVALGRNPANGGEVRRRARLAAIECLQFMDREEDMLRHAHEFIAEYPNFPEKAALYQRMGLAAMKLGRYDDAERFLRTARGLYVGDAGNVHETGLLLAEALEKQRKHGEAAEVLRGLAAAEKDAGRQAGLLLRAARLAWRVPDPDAVRADLARVLRDFPEDRAARARALSLLIDVEIAGKHFKEAVLHLGRYLEIAPATERGKLDFMLAWCHSELGEYDRAAAVLGKSVRSPAIQPDQRVTSQVFLVQILLFQKRVQEAAPHVRQLLAEKDGKAIRRELTGKLLAELGQAFARADDFRLAEDAWQRLLKTEKDLALRSEAYLGLARIQVALDRLADAGRTLDALAAERGKAGVPADQEQLSLMAELHLVRKEYSQALIYADKGLAARGGDPVSVVRSRWVKAQVLYEDEKDPKGALPYCIKCYVLSDDPVYSSRAMLLTIRILAGEGRRDDAAATWQELQRRYPVQAAACADDPLVRSLGAPAPGR